MEKQDHKEANPFESQKGLDDRGEVEYKNIKEMWTKELKKESSTDGEKEWYQKGNQYWMNTEATVNGVLGGFGELDTPDIQHSEQFLKGLINKFKLKLGRVIDCGAGIGRITKHLLARYFTMCDLCDQCEKYIEEAKTNLKDFKNIGHLIAKGLQELEFAEKYDCIWIQWVSNQIIDDDYIKLLELCKKSLNENGIIVVKENIAQQKFVVDKDDFSVTRSEEMYKILFDKVGLKIIEESWQTNFPSDLFKVKAFGLQPKK